MQFDFIEKWHGEIIRMKPLFILMSILFFIHSLVFISFAGDSSTFLKKEHVVESYGEITGLVSVDKQGVYIITNYKSRSRVDYRVLGRLRSKIAKLNGKIITVRGKITKIYWSGFVLAQKIISNNEK